jgi:glucosamine--fructose-6-phosphate aminotransferase (isomerizing)
MDADSSYLDEVAEQPDRLRDLADFYAGPEGRPRLVAWCEATRAQSGVLFSGMGTSEYAPLLVKHLLLSAGLRVDILDAGELYYYQRAVLSRGLLPVLVSQSGESVETRRLATECIAARSPLVVLTNDTESTMARHASLVLPLLAGHETAVTTKTYVNTLALLYLMARALSGDATFQRAIGELRQVAEWMASLDVDANVRQAAAFLLPAEAIQFVARGPSVVAAQQAALTFMEGARLPATALTAGAFRHGPFELAREGHRAVFFAPRGRTHEIVVGLARECAKMGSHVVLLTDADLTEPVHPRLYVLRLPSIGEELFSLLAATPQALLLHHVAAGRGFVAGIFEYGSKVTTRE